MCLLRFAPLWIFTTDARRMFQSKSRCQPNNAHPLCTPCNFFRKEFKIWILQFCKENDVGADLRRDAFATARSRTSPRPTPSKCRSGSTDRRSIFGLGEGWLLQRPFSSPTQRFDQFLSISDAEPSRTWRWRMSLNLTQF